MTAQAAIGNEIWSQIQVMVKLSIGARNGVVGDMRATIDNEPFPYQIHFNVNRGNSQKVLIALNGWDYYDIRFVRFNRQGHVTQVFGTFDNVSVEDLNEVILQADRA